MFSRLVRVAGALLVAAAGVFAQPAFADVVNGIDVETTLPQINHAAYSFQIVPTGPSGYAGPYTFQHISGSLPSGISISPSGVVSGTTCGANGNWPNIGIRITKTTAPVVVSDFIFRVNVTGGAGICGLTMGAAPPNGIVGTSYSASITATGGSNPKTYTVIVGSLPPGLSMNTSGAITGTPTAVGNYTFDVRASDGSDIGTATYTIRITAPLTVTPPTLLDGQTTIAYSQAFGATGGTAPYTFALGSGTLPTGLTLAGGTLSGTPTKAGTYNFTINASDTGGNTGSRSYTVNIAGSNIVSLSALPNGMLATAYNATITSSAGLAPYTYTITAGAPPPGLGMSSAGVVTGTPTVVGSYPFTVTSTDANGNFGTRAYTVVIGGANSLTIAPASIPAGTRNVAYSQTITASGGTPAYTYTLDSGALPAGITLASNGTLAGTPTATGTFNFVVRGTDAFGNFGTANYALVIAGATLTMSPSTLANGANGVAASTVNFTTTGGTAPYGYAVTAGALPNGLTLASNGTFSGTPATLAGTYNFSITSTDALGDTTTRGYAITIASASVAISPASLPNATINTPYSATFSGSGGASPYAYAVTSGALPPGLSLVGGVLSGTPTAAGTYTFSITATDANGDTHTTSYTFTIDAVTIGFTPTSLPNGTNGAAYSQSIVASGGTGPYTYVVDSGTLPNGFVLASDGTLSGTPAGAGTYNFVVRATDAATNTATQSYTVTIAAATISVTPASLSNATINTAYNANFAATGGAGGYSYNVTAGSLPVGLTLTGGALSGAPTATGTFNFTITATDSLGDTGSRAYALDVDAVTITLSPSTLPGGTNATAYSESLSASGGTGPYTYALSAGSLPSGLSLASDGTLSGTPSAAGSYNFTVTATDANTNTGSQAYTVVIASATISITPATLANATHNVAYSDTFSATGGAGPYTYSLSAGSLAPGMTFNSAGVLSGTPNTAGTFNFTITVTDANGDSSSQAYTFVVDAVTISVSPSTLPGGTNASAYSESLSASGGTGPYTYSLSAGSLPIGLSLSSTGTLSGTPSAAGSYSFTVTATDANTNTGSQAYTVVIAAATISITPNTLPNATNNVAYSESFTATGGAAPYSYSLSAGSLPVGMSFSSSGVLSGTPIGAGTFNFTITATDANGDSSSQAYTFVVDAVTIAVSPASLPGGTNASAYSETLSASGGTGPYTYALSAGSLPIGLSFSSTGTLSGTPTAAGTYNFTVTATDANTNTGSQAYSVVIAAATIAITPASLPNATPNVAYSETLTASGGAAPYTFSLSTGALPVGVAFSSAGVLSGTPTTAGTYNFTITATDANGDSVSQPYTFVVDTVTITLPTSLSNGVNATAYSQSINASGGAAPYTYAVTSGALPTGLALASNGTLSGSPTAAGTYTFTITATDANTNTGSHAYSVDIANATITITPASLPNCTNGTAYSHSLSATGGTGTYTFALAAGAMPVGMSLTSSGVFAGTPSSAGTYNFTVRATDGNGDVGTQAYSLAIGAASIDITPAALPGGRRGDAYTQALTAEGGTGPYTYAIGSGALPGGVTLAANGALSGTPTATGTFNVRIDAKDANGDIGQRTYAIAIAEAIALDITPGTLANGRKGTAVSTTFLTNGGTSPYTYAITGGALPSGVTLAANGTLSGTPTAIGSYSFTVRSNDNAGHTGTRTYAWVIAAALRADPTTLRDVRDTVTEQLGAARRLGELQMGNVFRRLDAGTAPCATAEGNTEEDCKTRVEVWANGTRETSYVGTTSAISAFTVGADMQLGPARVGAAFGDGNDVAELASGYRGDVDGKTWMLYGRVGLGEVFGIAAVAGRTDLDLDSRRMNDGAGATFGQRNGSTDFVGVELNATLMRGDGGVVPYIRYETASTDLDAYAETGGTLALQYGHVSADNTAFVAGAEAFITKRTSWGSLTPRFRAEYRDRSGDDVNQALWYVDTPNESFVLGVAGIDDRGAMVSMGLEAAFKRFRFSVDVGSASTADDWFGGTSIRFQLRADF